VTTAHLALGSNLGDRLGLLQQAVTTLATTAGLTVIAVSRVYETAPVGGPDQEPYLNAVVALDSELGPHELLALAHQIEDEAGRVRAERFGARTLDVDVLLVGNRRVDTDDLTVPHPRLWQRGFVLAPLADVAPHLVDRPADGWPGVQPTDQVLSISGAGGLDPASGAGGLDPASGAGGLDPASGAGGLGPSVDRVGSEEAS